MLKNLFIVIIFVASFVSNATSLTVSDVNITKFRVYETADDSVSVWLHINGSGRVGPNPTNSSVTCELWTNSMTVYSTALAAFMANKKVTIGYVDRGEGTHWCKVRDLSVNQ